MEVQIKDNKIYAPLKDKWLVLKPEEEVRQNYIVRLVNSYGYNLNQIEQDYSSKFKSINLDSIKYDIVVWRNLEEKINNNKPLIVIECKSDSIVIRKEDYFKGINLSKNIGAEFFVATNSKQTKIFSKTFKTNTLNTEEILDIPNNEEAQSESKIGELLQKTNEFLREDFSKTLFKCHNIIRNNDKLSPEAAFDEISKILFIKTLYERKNNEGNIFNLEVYEKEKTNYLSSIINKEELFYQALFTNVKKNFKDDDLFEPTEIIRIRENSFEAIVKELQIYNLSTTSDDVKGIAFEQFLGRTFRGELGQFFTPRTVVDFMVEVLDPQEGETICDPCCGSGGFLIKAFEYIRAKIEDEIQIAKDKIKEQYYTEDYEKLSEKEKVKVDDQVTDLFTKLNAELDINNDKGRLYKLSRICIYGTDANPRMSRTAKMNMIMHGDGHGGVHHNDGLLNVNGIFENRFDVILTNPPFGARVEKTLKITEDDKYTDEERIEKYRKIYGSSYDEALKQVNNNIDKPLLNLFETGKMSTLTEVLFIERCLNLLRPGGRMGIVLPEGVLNNTNLQKVRDFVEGKAKIILITSIPQDVFIASGATVKPSLLFFKKFTEEEEKEYNTIVKEASEKVKDIYKNRSKEIEEELAKKGKEGLSADEKKELKAEHKAIENKIETEIKAVIKEKFNYQIPIAEVEKAGISTTGAKIENDLEPLAEEFKQYRTENKLWQTLLKDIQYEVIENKIYRIPVAENNVMTEPEIFYN